MQGRVLNPPVWGRSHEGGAQFEMGTRPYRPFGLFLYRNRRELFQAPGIEIIEGGFNLSGRAREYLHSRVEQDLRRLPANVPRQDNIDIFPGY